MSPPPPPPTVAADPALAAGLRMVVMRLARRLRQQAEGEVTASQLSALATIDHQEPITLGELAAAEQIQPPSMTKIVAGLEQHGFVIRETDAKDRRIARVRLTEEGRRFLARSRTRRNAYLAERLRGFGAEERAVLERALPLLERLVDEGR